MVASRIGTPDGATSCWRIPMYGLYEIPPKIPPGRPVDDRQSTTPPLGTRESRRSVAPTARSSTTASDKIPIGPTLTGPTAYAPRGAMRPADAERSSMFTASNAKATMPRNNAAPSGPVWERFITANCKEIISGGTSASIGRRVRSPATTTAPRTQNRTDTIATRPGTGVTGSTPPLIILMASAMASRTAGIVAPVGSVKASVVGAAVCNTVHNKATPCAPAMATAPNRYRSKTDVISAPNASDTRTTPCHGALSLEGRSSSLSCHRR